MSLQKKYITFIFKKTRVAWVVLRGVFCLFGIFWPSKSRSYFPRHSIQRTISFVYLRWHTIRQMLKTITNYERLTARHKYQTFSSTWTYTIYGIHLKHNRQFELWTSDAKCVHIDPINFHICDFNSLCMYVSSSHQM